LTYFPHELTNDLNKQLQDFGLEMDKAEQLIEVEILIMGAKMLDPDINVEEVWSILIGYNEPIVPYYIDKKLLMRLRLYFPQYRQESNWLNTLETYLTIHKKYRQYSMDDKNIIMENHPRVAVERRQVYEKILKRPLQRKLKEQLFATKGNFHYTRTVDAETYFYKGELREFTKNPAKLPPHRTKSKATFDLGMDWSKIAYEMDQKSNNNYVDRIKRLTLKPINVNSPQTFTFDGVQHVVGGLGSGKSTWMVLQTYYQVTNNKVKVGFIENSVSQVLERVEELRALGLHAVPIIGKGSRKTHEDRFLSSKTDEAQDIDQFLDKRYQSIASLSDRCTIKALTDDDERNNYYPCTSIYQKNKKYICPLASTCGIYREWTDLADADVWVATTASLIESKMPIVVDPYERTVFEAMYDLLDIIFIDEADAVQQQLDDRFLIESQAVGNQDGFIENLLKLENQMLTGRYNDFAEDKLISKWRSNLREINKTIWPLFEKLKLNPQFARSLESQLLFTNRQAYEVAKKLTEDKELRKKIEEQLKEFAWRPDNDPSLYEQFQLLFEEKTDNQQIVSNITQKILKTSANEKKNALVHLEFYLYFAYMDYHIRFLISYYPAVQNRLGTSYEFSPHLTKSRVYKPFLLDAMTGTFTGYRYEQSEKNKLGLFKLVEYSGIGRKLLYDWHQLYKDAFDIEGPAIIALSGTSLAPGSNHYHLERKPNWLIQSEQRKPVIMQKYLPVFDQITGKSIMISGQHQSSRKENLSKLVTGLKNHIYHERNLLKKEGRRLLLVVNSYDDVEMVANIVEGIPELRDHYRFLTKNALTNEKAYSRFLIENYVEEKEEILIVPLMAVSRAYNILDKQNNALFGSIFFLVRPYPVPNDLSYMIQMLHANYSLYLNDIERKKLTYKEAVKTLRKRSIRLFEYMYKKPDFWSTLNKKEREALSWYIFIPVWQIIGRLIRGGRNARVYYCDGSFHNKNSNVPSLLEFWENKMNEHKHNPTMVELYGPFMDSIGQLFDDKVEAEI
jgi:hypothetical protein